MRTPISYYGGKQQLKNTLLEMIPKDHVDYCEGFVGGGTLFWAKEPSKQDIINDINGEVYNFYKVCQDKKKFLLLKEKIKTALNSRELHQEMNNIYKNKEKFDEVERAFAFYYMTNFSFNNSINSGWKFGKGTNGRKRGLHFKSKIDSFDNAIFERLKTVQIDNVDILRFIKNWDTEKTFFYLDPPYPEANQGHYQKEGFTMESFVKLLEKLQTIKGKFLLSSYDYPQLTEFVKKNKNWKQIKKEMPLSSSNRNKNEKQGRKVEVFTFNYELPKVNKTIGKIESKTKKTKAKITKSKNILK